MYHQRVINRSLEQQWTDEVHYLHSLWHQGPPHSNPNSNPTPTPFNLLPSSSTSFKKKKQKQNTTKLNETMTEVTPIPPVSNAEWEFEPVPIPQNQTAWPDSPVSKPQIISQETKEKLAAIQLQKKGLRASQEFFSKNRGGSEGAGNEEEEEEEEEVDEMEEEDSEDEEEGGESEELKFFLGIFKEDNELRTYYEKNLENGDFCCLVCGGIGEKMGKRFKNCVSLVQHSIAISKTKRRSAHRAFGKAICRVLGWNINRLPSIVLSLDQPLGQILLKSNSPEKNNHVENSVTEAANVGSDPNENIENDIHDSADTDKEGQSESEVSLDEASDDTDVDELYQDLDVRISDPNET